MSKKRALPFIDGTSGDVEGLHFFPCLICGELWHYCLVTPDQMGKISDSNTLGLCDSSAKRIYIHDASITHPIIIHELMHAFKSEKLSHSADLSGDQMEEMMCDIVGYQWFKVLLLAHLIYSNLSEYKVIRGDLKKASKVQWAKQALPGEEFIDTMFELFTTYAGEGSANPLFEELPASLVPKTMAAKKKTRRPS